MKKICAFVLIFLYALPLSAQKTFQERYAVFQAAPEYDGMPPLVIAAIKEDIPGINHFITYASFDDLNRAKEVLKVKIDILYENLNYVPPRDTREVVERAMDRDAIKLLITHLQGAMDMVIIKLRAMTTRS